MDSSLSLVIDLAVVAAYFIAVIAVGLKFGQRENTLESFALGNRSMPWWAVLASIIAAETSAATFLGMPGEAYTLVNYTYLQMVLGTIIGRLIVAFLFLKPFYDLKVFSIYEFLENRFGKGTRRAASVCFLVTRVLASGARLYVAAIVLAVGFTILTGRAPSAQQELLIYVGSIVAITVITAVYTSVGGIKAVIWTDCIQSTVMFTGAVGTVLTLIWQVPGGSAQVAEFFRSSNLQAITLGTTRGATAVANLTAVLTSDYTIWAALFGMTFTTLATHGTDQDMVQRMLTAPDYRKSRLSLVLSGLADVPVGFVFLTIGILLNLFYQHHRDPMLPKQTNEVFAYFILKQVPVGLRGLLVAGIFATSMGSLSAAMNALATSFTRDWLQQGQGQDGQEQGQGHGHGHGQGHEHGQGQGQGQAHGQEQDQGHGQGQSSGPEQRQGRGPEDMKGPEDNDRAVKAVRTFTYVFAVLMIIVATATAYFVIEHPDSRIIPIVLGIFGYTYGSLLGIFLLGLLTKTRGNDLGNYIAMIAGLILVLLVTIFFHVAYPWRIMFGAITTFMVGCAFRGQRSGLV